MHAAWFEKFGTAAEVLQVGELETPTPGPGEVLVRLACSAINPSDVKKRAGSFANLLDDGLVIPNSDGAGTIEAVGEGVEKSRIGERVWIYQAQFGRRLGTAAEYVAIDASRAPALQDAASFKVGACLGIPAMTAHRTVFADGDPSGKIFLVTGGAGRVGHYAIQWAQQADAVVVATASNDSDKQACLSAGASHVVNHRDTDWEKQVLDSTAGRLVDCAIDVEFGANLSAVLQVIRTGGAIHSYSSTQVPQPALPFFEMMYKDLTLRMIIVYAMPEDAKQDAISDIENALRDNALQHRIAHTLPMDDIVHGNELIESGDVRGAVILETG